MSVEISADGDTLVIVKDEPTRHVLRLTGDPRVFDDIIWFDVSLWDEPAGEPMSEPDQQLVLDALQAWCADAPNVVIAQHDSGFDVMLRAQAGVRLVGTHTTGHDTGYVTLLEVGRTVRVDVTLRFPRGLVKATFLRDTARWLYPVNGPVNDIDWVEIEAAIRAADRRAFYKDTAWGFE